MEAVMAALAPLSAARGRCRAAPLARRCARPRSRTEAAAAPAPRCGQEPPGGTGPASRGVGHPPRGPAASPISAPRRGPGRTPSRSRPLPSAPDAGPRRLLSRQGGSDGGGDAAQGGKPSSQPLLPRPPSSSSSSSSCRRQHRPGRPLLPHRPHASARPLAPSLPPSAASRREPGPTGVGGASRGSVRLGRAAPRAPGAAERGRGGGAAPALAGHTPRALRTGCRPPGSSERGTPCRAPTCPSHLPGHEPLGGPGGRRLPPPRRRCEGGCAKAPQPHRSCQRAPVVLLTQGVATTTEVQYTSPNCACSLHGGLLLC